VPLALRGLWGSLFSRKAGGGGPGPFSKIALAVGAPLQAAAATPEQLQSIVTALRGDWK